MSIVKSNAPVNSKKSNANDKRKVLEEDEYIDKMERIIRRDFYPDIKKQFIQKKHIEACISNDFEAKYDLEQQLQKVMSNDTEIDEENEDLPRLDQFHRKNVSEDNESFTEIMSQETEAFKEKKKWMFLEESENKIKQQLLITNSDQGQNQLANAQRKQLGWNYKTNNQLMFVPNGIERTEEDETKFIGAPKEISYSNTRFLEPATPTSSLNQKHKKETRKSSENGLFKNYSQQGNKKIDLEALYDETYAKLRNTPQRGSYDYLSTPVIEPGLAGESSTGDGNTFTTWGNLQSTPQILSSSRTPETGYSMPPTPIREQVAKLLTENASKQHRSKKAKTLSLASKSIEYRRIKSTNSPLSSPLLLSPSGKKRQQTGTPARSHFGSQLTKSYSSPAARSLRNKTPSRTPKKSLVSPAFPMRVQTPSQSNSITDNLLKL